MSVTYINAWLNDQTFSSKIVFITQNVEWLNGQTLFHQTQNNGKSFSLNAIETAKRSTACSFNTMLNENV